MATTMVKLYCLEAFDKFVKRRPNATLDTYIDALTVTGTGATEDEVFQENIAAVSWSRTS